jgi:hypothetical protein
MKWNNFKILIFFFIISKSTVLFSQKPYMMEIKYFDFSMTTDVKIECSEFESASDYQTIQINDSSIIAKSLSLLKSLKKDTLDKYMPDSRAKITIYWINGTKDVVCISNFGVCYNNVPMLYNQKYIDFIKRVIKTKDAKFNIIPN